MTNSESANALPTLPSDIANQLISQIASENIVLVGGQAVIFWAHYYGVAEQCASLTSDIDYFGQRADVEDASLRLINFKHEVKLSSWEDSSPNSGVIFVEVPEFQKKVRIDFLWAIQGLSGTDLRERAVTATIPGVTQPVQVLHPFMCLESKIANLGSFPLKRSPEGIEQTRLAIQVVRSLIEEMLSENRERDALKLVSRIANLSSSDASNYAYAACHADALQCIPVEKFKSNEFKNIRWPQIQAHTGDRRSRFQLLLPVDPSPQNTSHMRFRA